MALQEGGLSDADVIDHLRTRSDPTGYPIHNWRKGTVNVRKTVCNFINFDRHCVCVCACMHARACVCVCDNVSFA